MVEETMIGRFHYDVLSLIVCVIVCSLSVTSAKTEEQNLLSDNGHASLPVFKECVVCPEMVVLPRGHFSMGAPLEQSAFLHSLWYEVEAGVSHGFAHEGPVHEVEINIPFAIGKNEITRAEWMACVAEGGCKHTPDPRILQKDLTYYIADNPRHPVMNVNYFDILEYVAWLNHQVGAEVYRLPTEAEWEYAAKAGTKNLFAQGDVLMPDQANIGLFLWEGGKQIANENNRNWLVLVDELDAANPWGLRHIAGNASELTISCFSDRHLGLSVSSAYLNAISGISTCDRVVKGGRFNAVADYSRPSH
ncbi:formylglycine-generating enzyme family protein [Ascidiaceihabitans sp.]|uniref:formylglycine-generating enzyme family protein n=1 Tax=Ascidiaceihabitans sp. TaxID=1872644 RepID=UPI003299C51D